MRYSDGNVVRSEERYRGGAFDSTISAFSDHVCIVIFGGVTRIVDRLPALSLQQNLIQSIVYPGFASRSLMSYYLH